MFQPSSRNTASHLRFLIFNPIWFRCLALGQLTVVHFATETRTWLTHSRLVSSEHQTLFGFFSRIYPPAPGRPLSLQFGLGSKPELTCLNHHIPSLIAGSCIPSVSTSATVRISVDLLSKASRTARCCGGKFTDTSNDAPLLIISFRASSVFWSSCWIYSHPDILYYPDLQHAPAKVRNAPSW